MVELLITFIKLTLEYDPDSRQICVWCWHHIMNMAEKDETEGRCPACRTPYNKEKIVGAAKCERLFPELCIKNWMKIEENKKPKCV